MTIIFNGYDYKYEIESICKLFIPCTAFLFLYDQPAPPQGDYCLLEHTQSDGGVQLTSTLCLDGKTCTSSEQLAGEPCEKDCQRSLSVQLYRQFSKMLDITPKWGILTGIRPVGLIHKLRDEGYSDNQIQEQLHEKELVSEEKIKLSLIIADHQKQILQAVDPMEYSLYIAIPFCPTRCSYCSFVSHSVNTPRAKKLIQPYVDLLCEELACTAQIAEQLGYRLSTVYIGGGTPTAISAAQLKQVTDAVQRYFLSKAAVKEYTIEAGRADTITREKLEVIQNAGATRISINPQTFSDDVLRAIGRKHTAQQVLDTYQMAVDMGFTSINMDFIAGLPTDTLENFQATINQAIALNPANITVHSLSIKRSSTLYQMEEYKDISLRKSNPISAMVQYAQETLMQNGYSPYYLYRQKNTLENLENIGYAKEGMENLYNIYMMEEVQTILSAGASAVSKIIDFDTGRIERSFNFKYPYEYIDRFDQVLQRKKDILTLFHKPS